MMLEDAHIQYMFSLAETGAASGDPKLMALHLRSFALARAQVS